MTDKEINEAVARKLGYTTPCPPMSHLDTMGKENCIHRFPDYCHSIAAAWEVIDKLKVMALVKLSNGQWACNPTPPAFDDLVKADTAPMAICLAFLKLNP